MSGRPLCESEPMSKLQNMNNSTHQYDQNFHFIPTAPWVTRALREYVAPALYGDVEDDQVFDPCAGAGHMTDALSEWEFKVVMGADIEDYGRNFTRADYTKTSLGDGFDHIIMNPPFKLADQFVRKALTEAKKSVAVHIRLQWLEGQERHELFQEFPPSKIAIFSKRTPAMAGQVVRKKSVFMSHVWIVWDKTPYGRALQFESGTQFEWIPPEAQEKLERNEDYVKCSNCDEYGLPIAHIVARNSGGKLLYTGHDKLQHCEKCATARGQLIKAEE